MPQPEDGVRPFSARRVSNEDAGARNLTPEQFARVRTLFERAIELPQLQRSDFVREACGDDFELCAVVESLLANDGAASSFLEKPAVERLGRHRYPPTLTLGQRLGVYEIVAPLGAGGMGEVYLARDTKLGRDVAIKILPASLAGDPERLHRFEREARVLAALNHPHIGSIYGMEETGAGTALVLELVDGETLAEALRTGSRRWPIGRVLGIAAQIADALDAAHEKNIVHRDLKPANIKITPEGVTKVLDFGLAKNGVDERAADETQSSEVANHVTGLGAVLGTAAYMSPEQARGGVVDKRTDIWAFGCVLYEMLTGEAAFVGETPSQIITRVLESDPAWDRLRKSAPAAVHRLVQRCLDKDPRRRIRDAGDIRLQLEDMLSGMITITPFSNSAAALASRVRWWVATASVALLALAFWASRPLWSRPVSTPEFSRVTLLTSGQALESGPAISPDGKWIAYLSDVRGPTDVWVKFVSGGEAINLTASSTVDVQSRIDLGGLAISPNGSFIAFDAGSSKGTPANLFDAWVVPAPLGGTPRKIVELGRAVRWSPDGKQILFVRAGASAGDALFVAGEDGGSPREIVSRRGGMHIHWPAWSPDGEYIYFNHSISTTNSEPAAIYRVRSTGRSALGVRIGSRGTPWDLDHERRRRHARVTHRSGGHRSTHVVARWKSNCVRDDPRRCYRPAIGNARRSTRHACPHTGARAESTLAR